ncbi:MAG: hypothetical protein ACFB2Y_07115 [Fulvivirga sp.]
MLFINHFKDQLSYDRIISILDKQKEYFWMSYIFIPLLYLVKLVYATSSVYTGLFIQSLKISFAKVFSVILVCEPIFLLPKIVKFIWFYFFETEYDLLEFRYFYPFSALSITNIESLSNWFIYPLQMANLFELLYILVVAYFLKKLLNTDYLSMLVVTLISYGVGLLLWASLILFLTVSYS